MTSSTIGDDVEMVSPLYREVIFSTSNERRSEEVTVKIQHRRPFQLSLRVVPKGSIVDDVYAEEALKYVASTTFQAHYTLYDQSIVLLTTTPPSELNIKCTLETYHQEPTAFGQMIPNTEHNYYSMYPHLANIEASQQQQPGPSAAADPSAGADIVGAAAPDSSQSTTNNGTQPATNNTNTGGGGRSNNIPPITTNGSGTAPPTTDNDPTRVKMKTSISDKDFYSKIPHHFWQSCQSDEFIRTFGVVCMGTGISQFLQSLWKR